jgi:hypothetical protein
VIGRPSGRLTASRIKGFTMARIAKTCPAKKPARATAARAVRKPAKPTPVKATPAKATPAKAAARKIATKQTAAGKIPADNKAPAKKHVAAGTASPAAAIVARNATVAKTTKLVGDTPVVIEREDAAAWQSVERSNHAAVEAPGDAETGTALMARVTRAVERELVQIDAILAGDHNKPRRYTEAERRARTLASLARTLSEVGRLRAADEGHAYVPSAARDLDGFRKALWKRLEQSLTRRADVGSGGDDAAGDDRSR